MVTLNPPTMSGGAAFFLLFVSCRVLSGRGQDLVSSGLGSPEILPSVLEQATVDVSSLQEADDNFLLQPTPQGLKSYCIIQRTRSVVLFSFRAQSCTARKTAGTAYVPDSADVSG